MTMVGVDDSSYTGRLLAQVGWLGTWDGSHLDAVVHSSGEPGDWWITANNSTTCPRYCYLRQRGYVLPGVCLSVRLLATSRKNYRSRLRKHLTGDVIFGQPRYH